MKAIVVLILLSSPAWAQARPPSTDCDTIVRELKMRPPANGDRARAEYLWTSYIDNCEYIRGLTTEDVKALNAVLDPWTFK
jgi:hypothetical protein